MGHYMSDFLFPIILCHILLHGGGWFPKAAATTCREVTDYTCPDTLRSTGVCDEMASSCECNPSYVSDQYGCARAPDTPYITMLDENIHPYGRDDAEFTLQCHPIDKGENYVWYEDGAEVMTVNTSTLTVSNGRSSYPYDYRCKYSEGGVLSPSSDEYSLNFVDLTAIVETSPDIQSTIMGLPTTIINGTEVTMVVGPILNFNVAFTWTEALVNATRNGNTLTAVLTYADSGQNITCLIEYTESSTIRMVSPATSIPTISDNIPDVQISDPYRFVPAGATMSLTCEFDEENFIFSHLDITWEWYFNDTKNDSFNTQTISVTPLDADIHQGEWRCAAQYESQPKRESSPINVYVDYFLRVSLTLTPAIPVAGGYLEVGCSAETPEPVELSYTWTKNADAIDDYDDHTLFFDDLDNSAAATYRCTVRLDEAVNVNLAIVNTPVSFSESTPPSLTVNNTGGDFVFGETYLLTCTIDEDYSTPGFSIQFLQDDSPIYTGDDNVYVFSGDVNDRNFTCRTTFNSSFSNESNAIFVTYPALIDNVQIKDANGTNVTAINVLVDTMITLSCDVSVRIEVMQEPSVTWDTGAMIQVGMETDLQLSNLVSSNVTYFCTAVLGSHSLRSAGVTIFAYEFGPPTLSLIDNVVTSDLTFTETYNLHCDLGALATVFDFQYSFFNGPMVELLQSGTEDTYEIVNNVSNTLYICQAFYMTDPSMMSNNLTTSFEVFGKVEIKDSNNAVVTSLDTVVNTTVILQCDVTLQPGVSGESSVFWYNVNNLMMDVGVTATLEINVTEEGDATYLCVGNLGSHTENSVNNVSVNVHALDTPVLSMLGGGSSQSLDYQDIHQLHCEGGDIALLFDIGYTFFKDGVKVVTNSSSDTYTITNDVTDRAYKCETTYLTLKSVASNTIDVSFSVFDTLEIRNTNNDVITSMIGIVDTSVNLTSHVILQPGVPGQASISWYDDVPTQVGTDSSLIVSITEGLNVTYNFEANLGSHSFRSSNNVTIIGYVLEAPVLNLTNDLGGDSLSLDFSLTYYLQCDVGPILSTIALQYEFLRNDDIFHTDVNDTFEMPNDVIDRKWSCQASYQTVTSPTSNSVNTSFEVFENINITDAMRCHVRSEMNPTFLASLTCDVSLLSGVPEQINYTWYDENDDDISSSSTYYIFVSADVNRTFICRAEIGSHVQNFSSSYELVYSSINIPCCAVTFDLSLYLLAALCVTTWFSLMS